MRAVVVDDSEVALRSMCALLKRQQAIQVVATAKRGQQALDLVRRLRPKVMLVDVHMPEMNGMELADRITRFFPEVVVIMVSVNDSPEIREACRATGAHWFIPKARLGQELPPVLKQIGARA